MSKEKRIIRKGERRGADRRGEAFLVHDAKKEGEKGGGNQNCAKKKKDVKPTHSN